MSASTSPFVLPSYKFHGSSTNIVKDHLIEKESLSRRASQQITQIMLKNRSRSKFLNIVKSVSVLCVILLCYLQFTQGSSINKLIHENLQFDSSSFGSQKEPLFTTVDLSQKDELLDSIFALLTKNEPIFDEQIAINTDKLEILQNYKKQDKILTENVLLEDHFMQLTESQESSLLKSHSNLFIDIYSKMHNLIKIFHQHFEHGQNGILVYNDHSLNFQESIITSRLTIDSLLKTNTKIPIQIIFHTVDDENNEDYRRLCTLDQISCVHLQSESLLAKHPQLNDSILKKIAILISNKFDKLIILQSGSIVLNNLDAILDSGNQNFIFWSEKYDKRLTNPIFYTITESSNVYGHKRERTRVGKDETFKYFIQTEEDQKREIPFHDLEDTLIDSTTDSTMVFLNKKTNLNVLILSMYYDFYNTIYYPLLMASLPQRLSERSSDSIFENENSLLPTDNSFSETLLLSAFASNSKYYQVYKKIESINNGELQFNPIQDLQSLNLYYKNNLKELLPSSLEMKLNFFDPAYLNNFINKELEIKPIILTDINFKDIFSKEKFFSNVFDHEFYLNNNQVDPDLILSDLILNMKKSTKNKKK